jgi:hypothetical protein
MSANRSVLDQDHSNQEERKEPYNLRTVQTLAKLKRFTNSAHHATALAGAFGLRDARLRSKHTALLKKDIKKACESGRVHICLG